VVGDTALEFWVAGTSSTEADSSTAQGSPPYYGSRTVTKRFSEGAAEGNLSEVGFGWGASGSTLFSHALILDGGLNPTTITVLFDEFLDVSYECRLYPPLVDGTGSTITLDGVVYDVITRASSVTANRWYRDIGNVQGPFKTSSAAYQQAFSGNLGVITAGPSGSVANMTLGGAGSVVYGNNDLYRDSWATWGLNDGNIGGIRSIRVDPTTGSYQTQFDAVSGGASIPKDDTKTLTVNWRVSWDRH
jgi:hypothetical protein